MGRAYKRYLPRSLFGRALTILLAPIVLLQVVVAGLFIQNHYAGVTQQMAAAVALELNYAIETVETAPDVETARAGLETLARPLGLTLALDAGATVSPISAQLFYDVSGSALAERLRAEIKRPIAIDLLRYDRDVEVKIQTEKGVMRALIPRKRVVHGREQWEQLGRTAVLHRRTGEQPNRPETGMTGQSQQARRASSLKRLGEMGLIHHQECSSGRQIRR